MKLGTIYEQVISDAIGLRESKATEQQAMGVIKRFDDREEILNGLKALDKSKNQKNLPFMAVFYANGEQDMGNIGGVFDEYETLINKNRIKPLNYSRKGGLTMGDKKIENFIQFAEYIHAKTEEHSKKPAAGSSVSKDFEAEKETLWSGNGIDIYDGTDVGKCIAYTQGGLTGKGYGFCIGQPGNTMYKSYRDSKTSSFYFIVDKNKFKDNEDGTVNLDDPLHIVVFDNSSHGIELTDANNHTGNIAEYGSDSEGYISYLKSKGVPVDEMVSKPKTPEEEEEDKLLGKKNKSLEWFMKLPMNYKSAYIGRGHLLTDEQFDYLIGN
jgi:hypothetical protein